MAPEVFVGRGAVVAGCVLSARWRFRCRRAGRAIAVTDPYENLHATIDALQRRKTDEATTGLLGFQARVLVEILDELHQIRRSLPPAPEQDADR